MVHGCFQERQMFHKVAQKDNDDFAFRLAILVNDLTMKGPDSVIFANNQNGWQFGAIMMMQH
jgi:hypothetical protein